MSQPFNQQATCPAPGELDTELGEFWMENPWQPTEHNLSAFERNRILLNSQDGKYIDLSYATGGADSDSDSRAVVAADFDEDGRLDLLVRNSGGGPVRLYRNLAPAGNWIKLTLNGVRSNSKGLGAQVTATINGKEINRLLQAPNGFLGQSPAEIHLGLEDADIIEELIVQWPSGTTQRFANVAANKHWVVNEDEQTLKEFRHP